MPDFAAFFPLQPDIAWQPPADPYDTLAVIMPYTAINDVAPPVVTQVSPALGFPLDRAAAVVADVEDLISLKLVNVWIEYPTGEWETAYARDQNGVARFSTRFRESTLVDLVPGLKKRLTLKRRGGWPYGTLSIRVEGIDGAANGS